MTWLVLGLVTLQRLGELLLARRNTARLLAQGAYEIGAGHYPLIVVLHAGWLGGLWFLAPGQPLSWGWLGAFVALQVLRAWIMGSLGERWTTRIVVLPGAAPVRRGPYRFLAHPNYMLVAAEIAVLPLAFELTGYALVFSVLNAWVLFVRIGVESAALARASQGR